MNKDQKLIYEAYLKEDDRLDREWDALLHSDPMAAPASMDDDNVVFFMLEHIGAELSKRFYRGGGEFGSKGLRFATQAEACLKAGKLRGDGHAILINVKVVRVEIDNQGLDWKFDDVNCDEKGKDDHWPNQSDDVDRWAGDRT